MVSIRADLSPRVVVLVVGLMAATRGLVGVGLADGETSPAGSDRNDQQHTPLPRGVVLRLGSERLHAADTLRSVVLSPDGKLVAGSDIKGFIHLWEISSGGEQHCFRAGFCVASLAFSPDRRLLAGASRNGECRVWEITTGKCVLVVEKRTSAFGGPTFVAFHPNSGHLLFLRGLGIFPAGDVIEEIRIQPHAVVRRVIETGVNEFFDSMAMSRDGKVLVVGCRAINSSMRELRFVEAATGRLLSVHQVEGHGDLGPLAFSPDGKSLARGDGDSVIITDLVGSRPSNGPPPIKTGQVTSLALASDGDKLVASCRDGSLRVCSISAGRVIKTIEHAAGPFDISSDGKILASGSGCTIRLWDLTTFAELLSGSPGHLNPVNHLVFAPDGRSVATVDCEHLWRWDSSSGRALQHFAARGQAVVFSRDGSRLLTLPSKCAPSGWRFENWNIGIAPRVWDVVAGIELAHLCYGPHAVDMGSIEIRNASFSLDGLTVLTVATHMKDPKDPGLTSLRRWDASSGRLLSEVIRTHETPSVVAISADSRLLAWNAEPHGEEGLFDFGAIHVVDSRLGKDFQVIRRTPLRGICALAFSPSNELLASGTYDGRIDVWEIATGKAVLRSASYGRNVGALAFSPDGRFLAAADYLLSQAGDTDVGDHVHWTLTSSIGGYVSRQSAAASVIWIWDLAAGREVARFEIPAASVSALDFAPDGGRLACSLSNGTAIIYGTSAHLAPPESRTPPSEVEELWKALGDSNPRPAYRAAARLAAMPRQATDLLRCRLRDTELVSAADVRELLASLDSELFEEREKGMAELKKLRRSVEPALRTALEATPSLEARQRLEAILAVSPARPTEEELRIQRALEVLSWICTADARDILARLAKGPPELSLTRDAKATLERMNRRLDGVRPSATFVID